MELFEQIKSVQIAVDDTRTMILALADTLADQLPQLEAMGEQAQADKVEHLQLIGTLADVQRRMGALMLEKAGLEQRLAAENPLLTAVRDGVPLTEPVYIGKAMLAQKRAHVVLENGTGPAAAVHLENISMTGWILTAETAEQYAAGFNQGAAMLRRAVVFYASQLPAGGVAL